MSNALTFIIPVCHPENCKDWETLKRDLKQTMLSIAAQSSKDWTAIVVANFDAELPPMPRQFLICRVNFLPNPFYAKGSTDVELFRESVRLDKGKRILAGMLFAGSMQHVMVVDADDLVSNRLVAFVCSNPTQTGWYFPQGYAYEENSNFLFLYSHFHALCGTSHIIRADLFDIPIRPEDASDSYIRQTLGSHISIAQSLKDSGNALSPLPFAGAIYRMGHRNSHSRSMGVFRSFVFQRSLLWKPWRLLGRITRLRYLSNHVRSEFFGAYETNCRP